MKKAYAIIVSFIAFFEFSYIMYYGGFTFSPMDRTRAAPVTAAAAPVYTQPTSSYKIGSTRRPTTPPTFPPTSYNVYGPGDDPTAAPEYHQYVANTKTKKFHKPSCSSAKQISYANRAEYYCTREEMIRRGYDPCQHCYH